MIQSDKPQITSSDEPLFVLKYRGGHSSLRILCDSLLILVLSGLAVVAPLAAKSGFAFLLLFELLVVFFLSSAIFQLVDLILFKEVRLYEDRIVKVRRFVSKREIKLAEAGLATPPTRLRAKTVCKQGSSWFSKVFAGIFYYEDLPDPKEVKKLNYLLAALSGRKPRELEEARTIERLIKKGNEPLSIDKQTLDNLDTEVLRDYAEEKQFNRIPNKALAVVAVFMLLAIVLLWFFMIWGKSIQIVRYPKSKESPISFWCGKIPVKFRPDSEARHRRL